MLWRFWSLLAIKSVQRRLCMTLSRFALTVSWKLWPTRGERLGIWKILKPIRLVPSAAWLEEHAGKKVYIHCKGGHSRSSWLFLHVGCLLAKAGAVRECIQSSWTDSPGPTSSWQRHSDLCKPSSFCGSRKLPIEQCVCCSQKLQLLIDLDFSKHSTVCLSQVCLKIFFPAHFSHLCSGRSKIIRNCLKFEIVV